jgi:hypothetical protein
LARKAELLWRDKTNQGTEDERVGREEKKKEKKRAK